MLIRDAISVTCHTMLARVEGMMNRIPITTTITASMARINCFHLILMLKL